MFRSYNLDELVQSPACSLMHMQGTQWYPSLYSLGQRTGWSSWGNHSWHVTAHPRLVLFLLFFLITEAVCRAAQKAWTR